MEEEIKKRVHEKVHSQAEEMFEQQRKVSLSDRATIYTSVTLNNFLLFCTGL